MRKYLPLVLFLILLGGSIFAWYTVVNDFILFYGAEGTLLKVAGCARPNPVTTPCFYGAFAFVATMIWSFLIWQKKVKNPARQILYLTWLLVGCVLFAWTNFFITLSEYLRATVTATTAIGCSGMLVINPLNTPCFIGSMFFLTALVVSYASVIYHRRLFN